MHKQLETALLLYSRTGPRGALSLKLSDTRVYEPEIRTRLGKTPPRADLTKLPCRCINLAFDLTAAT